ncbi:Crp/Fnr family transcriptional regulator [Marivirga sp.]|uniref:Crp/Fnr family transcriptional regulator n=1 Tax=Marivirga sp. TaxID=2018662 RepID=UPI003DA721BA
MTITEYLAKKTSLSSEQIAELGAKFSSKEAMPGDYVIKEGEVCRKLLFLREGCMAMVYERDNKSFIKDFIFENSFASVYESFITSKPARYALKAITHCKFESISLHDLEKTYQSIPQLKALSASQTEAAYLNITRRMESLITLSAEKRYLELLERRPRLLSEIPLYLIASYLGITDVALSRIRKKIGS